MYLAIKGVYNKGQIQFLEKIPDIEKANVLVLFESDKTDYSTKEDSTHDKFSLSKLKTFGMWKDRKDIDDDLEYARQLRDQWDRNL